jgi:hypothetical protein
MPQLPSNERLLNALVAVGSNNTPQTHNTFYSELLKSTVLLAQDPETASRPILFVNQADEIMLPIFTDLERLNQVCPDAQGYSPIPFRNVCQLALRNAIYIININPEYGPGGYLYRDEIEALANNTVPAITPAESASWDNPDLVPMGDPDLPASEVLEQITDTAESLLEKEPTAEAAYIILLGSGETKSVLTIALHFTDSTADDQKTEFTRQLVNAVEAVTGQPLRVVWLEGEQLKAVASRVEPFYQRGARL